MRPAAPAAVRFIEPHPESARLRRLTSFCRRALATTWPCRRPRHPLQAVNRRSPRIAGVDLYRDLARRLDYNLFYSERGHFTLAHSSAALRTQRWRAEVNRHLGIDSEVVGREFIKRTIPEIDLDCGGHQPPIAGALYHPPGAIARHDAVAWAYARGADRAGAEIHQQTAVTGIELADGRVAGVHTDRGFIATGKVLSAVAGWTPQVT